MLDRMGITQIAGQYWDKPPVPPAGGLDNLVVQAAKPQEDGAEFRVCIAHQVVQATRGARAEQLGLDRSGPGRARGLFWVEATLRKKS